MSSMWMITISMVTAFNMVMQATQKKQNSQKEKWSSFECGFNNMTNTNVPFSFQFFFLAILFLIFDVEISIMISYPMEPANSKKKIMMATFISAVTIGLMYEWEKGKLEWSK